MRPRHAAGVQRPYGQIPKAIRPETDGHTAENPEAPSPAPAPAHTRTRARELTQGYGGWDVLRGEADDF